MVPAQKAKGPTDPNRIHITANSVINTARLFLLY